MTHSGLENGAHNHNYLPQLASMECSSMCPLLDTPGSSKSGESTQRSSCCKIPWRVRWRWASILIMSFAEERDVAPSGERPNARPSRDWKDCDALNDCSLICCCSVAISFSISSRRFSLSSFLYDESNRRNVTWYHIKRELRNMYISHVLLVDAFATLADAQNHCNDH